MVFGAPLLQMTIGRAFGAFAIRKWNWPDFVSGQPGLYTLRRRHQIHDVCVIKPLANRRDWACPDAQRFYFAPYSLGTCRILSTDSASVAAGVAGAAKVLVLVRPARWW